MKNSDTVFEIEQKLKEAAGRLPEPRKPVPVLQRPEKECGANARRSAAANGLSLRRIAVIALAFLGIGATTAFAASPAFREAVIRLFTAGVVEEPPMELLNPTDHAGEDAPEEKSETAGLHPSQTKSGAPEDESAADTDQTEETAAEAVQTVGDLTLVPPEVLDEHFTALYVSSKNYLDLVPTPSGDWLFSVQGDGGVPIYYAMTDGRLQEAALNQQSLTAALHPERLPGIMDDAGNTYPVSWPAMECTVFWQRYGSDILLDGVEPEGRFDIGSTFGGVTGDYDGMFGCRAFPGRTDRIQIFLYLDYQRTSYSYPFVLNLDSGEVSDPLAGVDFSAYPCITELEIADDLQTATALAGESREDLRKITVDLATGQITEAASLKPPVADCFTWFATGEYTLFYGVGDDSCLDGYLYDIRTQSSTLLFGGAASHVYEAGFSERRYRFIGGGYAVYREGDDSFLVDLHDGTFIRLEGIPSDGEADYFFNKDFTVLSISMWDKEENLKRQAFLIPATGEAAWFSRKLPEQVKEYSSFWSGPFCYAVQAKEENNGRHYLYLYQYTP